jgi:hypothetical protein
VLECLHMASMLLLLMISYLGGLTDSFLQFSLSTRNFLVVCRIVLHYVTEVAGNTITSVS